jgi:PEP-CTERM motif
MIRTLAALVVTATITAPAAAGFIFSGAVTYDASAGTYTYGYRLDIPADSYPVNEVSVLIARDRYESDLRPSVAGLPSGWEWHSAAQGGPTGVTGTFWQWYSRDAEGSQPGQALTEFSFTTSQPPALGDAPNYFLFSNTFDGGPDPFLGVLEVGRVPAPEVFKNSPEPATLGMAATAAAVVWLRRRRPPPRQNDARRFRR